MHHPDHRKIGRHHLAFYRGWLHGLDLKTLADRYLETGLDLRLAKTTLDWLRDTLSQAALRHGRRGEARLMRLHLAAVQGAGSEQYPSLEDFRAERDPDGFYSEAELIEIYLDAYPQAMDKRSRQRQRLVDRQIAAIVWIEQLLVTDPVPGDLVSAWFDKGIADRLILAGIGTIGDLLIRIRGKGHRWWMTVPKLGEKGAARIIQWLGGYEESLGSLPGQALLPIRSLPSAELLACRQQQMAIVPFEVFALPGDLDGRTGSNRYPGTPRIQADNDYQAIQSWLATKSASKNTHRAYRKEVERMLLWAVIERGKALTDLSVNDCTDYRNWLSMIGRSDTELWPFNTPQADWIAPRNTPRFSNAWRPFDGALSTASVKHALVILGSFFEWLVRVQYCAFNPWDAVGKAFVVTDEAPSDIELTRVFSVGQWEYLMDYVDRMPMDERSARLRFILSFAHATGLRLAELVDATIGRIYTMPLRDSDGLRWMLKVFGKGGKWRSVPIPDRVVSLLRKYLVQRGLDDDLLSNPPETAIIARAGVNEAVSPGGLAGIIRGVFADVAVDLKSSGRDQEAKAFTRATAHWLRHTCGSHLGLSGVPVNLIQKLLGHASVATTSIYMASDDERLWQAITDLEVCGAN